MNPNRDHIDWIRSFVATLPAGWGTPVPGIVAAANDPAVTNPAPRATTAKKYGPGQIFNQLDAAALTKLRGFPSLSSLRDAIQANDGVNVTLWLSLLFAAGDVTVAQRNAIQAILSATEPDPSYPALVGAAMAAIGRDIDQLDVLEARP